MATKFCRRCGSALQDGDRFCGECGAPVPGVAANPDEPTQAADVLEEDRAEDFFAEWENVEPLGPLPEDQADEPTRGPKGRPGDAPPDAGAPVQASPDQSPTEAIPTARAGDTAVMPQMPSEPYMAPGAPRRAGPRPGPALAPPPPGPPAYQAGPARPPSRGFPVGATFSLLGAVAVLVSALLPWATGDLTGTVEPRDLPFQLLLDPDGPGTGPSLGLVVLGLGLLGAFLALLTMVAPAVKFLRRIVGLVTLAAPGLFVWRLVQGLLEAGAIDQLLSTMGPGLYVVTAGAFTQIVSGRWFRR
jgi:zinc-ribbon domain